MSISRKIFGKVCVFVAAAGLCGAEIQKAELDGMPYQLFVPELAEGQTAPLVVCLHGALGRGTDNQARGIHAYDVLKDPAVQAEHPCFLLAPQCAKDFQWVDTPWANGSYDLDAVPESVYMKKVARLIFQTLEKNQSVDPSRVYATGQSMGGFGCWDLILRYPDWFAAAVPVCGGGSPGHARRVKNIPLWIFHGRQDPTVPVSASRQMAVALKECGGRVKKYSEFPDGGHAIMNSAWRAPGLIDWLFDQRNTEALRKTGVQYKTDALRPNIVLILADDLGYGDLSVQGCTDFSTPHIDSIAAQGRRFTDAYVTGPVCAPSRAGLLSGRWQNRFGFHGNPAPHADWGLPVEETTLADSLKAAGYRTAVFGKWHVGEAEGYRPLERGFDEFYGFLSGKHSYWNKDDDFWGPIVEGDAKPAELNQYLTFELADRACGFIAGNWKPETLNSSPFFLYLSFNAPHAPMEAPGEYIQKARHIEPPDRRLCAAMVMALDDAVGQVLDSIQKAGIENETLVLFMSDNGAAMVEGSDRNGGSNGPLRGSKAQLWEGGVRVPFFAKWPGTIPAGTVSSTPVISLDLFPTFGNLAGAEIPAAVDGVDLMDLFSGKANDLPARGLFWKFYDTQSAARRGDMKWTRVDQACGLFNVAQDLGECDDLRARHPEVCKDLQMRWQKWNKKNAPPIHP